MDINHFRKISLTAAELARVAKLPQRKSSRAVLPIHNYGLKYRAVHPRPNSNCDPELDPLVAPPTDTENLVHASTSFRHSVGASSTSARYFF